MAEDFNIEEVMRRMESEAEVLIKMYFYQRQHPEALQRIAEAACLINCANFLKARLS